MGSTRAESRDGSSSPAAEATAAEATAAEARAAVALSRVSIIERAASDLEEASLNPASPIQSVADGSAELHAFLKAAAVAVRVGSMVTMVVQVLWTRT